jgi:hypothetical protein
MRSPVRTRIGGQHSMGWDPAAAHLAHQFYVGHCITPSTTVLEQSKNADNKNHTPTEWNKLNL